ncbi:hypothetical protein BCT16_07180 [Vibrio sp. 10N.222.54.B6]|nr:hypothetical protein BCT21_20700 [Vibrio sp. 10N.222.55.F9]PMN97228.1 hypothetical protein BCT20_18000 [Vibrio sp. 10N.222.55.C12]PMO21095.1 hypothetical protein BCT17_04010 [Vibrio sp. 10N.222.54.F10]PMO21255.1 hypothetical protein BCT16_07180 [Vibrio sp. 10N.222.54.B6]TKF38536.1 hypothetical protein FCV49_21760 [Vibrio sp. F13]
MKNLPQLKEFRLVGSTFPVVDPTDLPQDVLAALDKYMIGKTVSHPIYIYVQDWIEFCGAVERGNIHI